MPTTGLARMGIVLSYSYIITQFGVAKIFFFASKIINIFALIIVNFIAYIFGSEVNLWHKDFVRHTVVQKV